MFLPETKPSGPVQSKSRSIFRALLLWSLPVLLGFVFLLLFSAANPFVERLLDFIVDFLRKFHVPSFSRIFFWFFVFVLLAALFSMRILTCLLTRFISEKPKLFHVVPEKIDFLRAMGLRSLILFNVLFLLPNLLDVEYLWAGACLPDGMTYASYAHRGAYPLIATVILAGLFVLAVCGRRSEKPDRTETWLFRLTWLFLAQNLFLVLSAVLRLVKYVQMYALTNWRIAAFLWMALVFAGLVLLILKIRFNRTADWLIRMNCFLLFAMLTGCSFCNFDGIVCAYNLKHPLAQKNGFPVDIMPFVRSDWGAFPQRILLVKRYPQLKQSVILSRAEIQTSLKNWRTFSLYKYRIEQCCLRLEGKHASADSARP